MTWFSEPTHPGREFLFLFSFIEPDAHCLYLSSGIPSNRYSIVSTSETFNSGLGTAESNHLFRQSQSFASMSQVAPSPETNYGNVPQLALPPPRGASIGREHSPSSTESGTSNNYAYGSSEEPSASNVDPYYQPFINEVYQDEAEQPILPSEYTTTSPEPVYQTAPARVRQPSQRGVSLVDTGPVRSAQAAPHDAVRRVSRHQRRSSSKNQLVSPISSGGHTGSLPPGAVSS